MPRLGWLFLLVLALPVLAQNLDLQPKLVGSATAVITLNWTVDLAGQRVSELSVNTFGFKDYPSQNVLSEAPSLAAPVKKDGYGNNIRVFTLDPNAQFQSFGMISRVQVAFPFSFKKALPGDAEHYLQQSPYVSFTPEIRDQALQVTNGLSTDLQRVTALAQWVHNNVRYDTTYLSTSLGASQVFKIRAGTCDEFSHLLIAMLRSIGIPAKFSASFVYSGTDWGAHAFVEALVEGQWIPVDPTFNEAVLLDATHIKFGEGLDQQDIKEDVAIRSFAADVGKIQLQRTFNVELEDPRPFPHLFDLSLDLPQKRVGSESLETISVKIRNGGQLMAVPLSLNVPKEVIVQGPNSVSQDQLVLMQPNEEKTVSWKLLVPKLDANYVYKFPVTVASLGQNVSGTLEASVGGQRSLVESLDVPSLDAVRDGEFLQLYFTLKNTGNRYVQDASATLSMAGYNVSQNVSLAVGESQEVSFRLPVPADREVRGTLFIDTELEHLRQPVVVSLEESPSPSDFSPSPRDAVSVGAINSYALTLAGGTAFLLFILVLYFATRPPKRVA